jgi:hypothetical protein
MLLLAVPWLLLAIVAMRAARPDHAGVRRRTAERQARRIVPPPSAMAEGESRLSMMSDPPLPPEMADSMARTPGAASACAMPEMAVPAADEPAVDEFAADDASSRRAVEQRLVTALETAEANNDQVGLARDSVELARLLIARNAQPAAEVLLRKAVIVARRAKLPETHAEARIELAELARAGGDLTSACEHWQMAKLMFHETGRRGDQDRMADVMRQNRCPTDWVLTGF